MEVHSKSPQRIGGCGRGSGGQAGALGLWSSGLVALWVQEEEEEERKNIINPKRNWLGNEKTGWFQLHLLGCKNKREQ